MTAQATHNSPAGRDKAAKYLGQLKEYFSQTYNTRFLIETLALQAILDLALGNKFAALTVLEKALRLAQPGGFISIFVDLGSQMARALTQLNLDGELHDYVKQILSAFPGSQQVVGSMESRRNPGTADQPGDADLGAPERANDQ